MKPTKINAPKIIAGSFLGAIVIGTILLSLPISTAQNGSMPMLDALFTATSAICVTGLTVVDTGTHFTHFGQIIILILIQIGGLGIMTMSTFFLVLLGKRLQMKDLFVIEGSLGKGAIHGVKGLVKYILFITFGFELIGAVVLFFRFITYAKYPIIKAIYHAVFHSVSAFCNAGFSLYTDSLARYNGDWITILTIALLIICGGLGFIVLLNINTYKFWKKDIQLRGRLKLQTKIVLNVTLVLLIIGFAGIILLEWNNALGGLLIRDKFVNSFFHSATPRTTGFNTLNIASMRVPTLCFILFLMFVGASPGSTGGGIKTSTFMVLVANAYSIIRGKMDIQLFGRTIPKRVVQEATCIMAISMGLIFISTVGLLISEGSEDFMKVVFEVFSAFSNVGLSTGITSALTNLGKLIIIITMYIGRISPLMMALVVGRREELPAVGYPIETVMVG